MIIKTQSFQTSDNQIHATIEAAQAHELTRFLASEKICSEDNAPALAENLIVAKDRIIDLLTLKASSRPKARKVNGGTRKKKPAPAPAEAPATEPQQ